MALSPDEQRLTELERRVRHLELVLGVKTIQNPPVAAEPMRQVAPAAAVAPISVAPIPVAPAPFAPVQPTPRPMAAPPPLPKRHEVFELHQTTPVVPSPVLTYPSTTPPKPLRQNPLEQVIGIKWAGWIGAIVLVIGAALGIKYAYDEGLFPTVSPTARLVLMSLGGFALIGAGEWVFRKVGRLSATGFFGAGVATLYIISYAGHGYYQLYTRDTAFVMMALCTLIGAAVAMRAQLVSVAVLALIGGNIAPIVLHGDATRVVPFLSYLLMLQIVALVLAFWGGSEKWWTLRGLSLGTTAFWVASLLNKLASTDFRWGSLMWVSLAFGILYHGELLLSALRHRQNKNLQNVGTVFSLATTALLSLAVLRIFKADEPTIRGSWLLMFAAIATAISLLLRRTLPALSISYRVQAAALLLVSVPVILAGANISVAWAILAMALAAVGGLLEDRTARAAAVVAWVLALLNLTVWTNSTHPHDAHAIWLTIMHQPLAAWAILAAAIAWCGHAVAFFIGYTRTDDASRRAELERSGAIVSFLSSAVFAATTIAVLPPLGATGVLLAYTWFLALLDSAVGRLALAPQAWCILLLAAAKWAAIDTLAARLSPDWSATQYRPVFNPLMLTALAIGGSLIGMFRLRRESISRLLDEPGEENRFSFVSVVIATIVITFGLSFEVDRVVEQLHASVWPLLQLKLMGWTILWSIAATAMFAVIFAIDRASLARHRWRGVAWTICALLTAKFLILDTTIWIASSGARAPVLLNMQNYTAAIVVAMMIAFHCMLRRSGERSETSLAHRIAFAATLVVLWAGTLELSRMIDAGIFPTAGLWNFGALKQFAWTSWWTIGFAGFLAFTTRLDPRELASSRLLRAIPKLLILLCIKYLILDSELGHGFRPVPAPVLFNAQAATGGIVLAALIFVRRLLPGRSRQAIVAAAVAVLIPLWVGTMEIDRAFHYSTMLITTFADPDLAEQVALSIFFSIYAITTVAAGFRLRVAGLRYFGLILFALTLAKVGIFDLSHASAGYRFLSFIGLGGLLLVTSVLYGRLSPRLLAVASAPDQNS